MNIVNDYKKFVKCFGHQYQMLGKYIGNELENERFSSEKAVLMSKRLQFLWR